MKLKHLFGIVNLGYFYTGHIIKYSYRKEAIDLTKRNKRLILTGLLLMLVLVLSGCVSIDEAGNPSGWFYEYLVIPTQGVINWLAEILGNNYGWAIILFTIIVRLILFPLTLSQQRSTTEQQIRMNAVKDVTAEIQEELKATDNPNRQQQLQKEMSDIYNEAGISLTGGMGCLPLLIQLPIISMVFSALRYSPEIANATFLGVQLGESNFIFALVAGLTYLIQAFFMIQGVPEEQRATMRTTAFMSPIMIFIFSLSSPSGIALYWIVGGVFAIAQSYYTNNFFKPRLEAELNEEIGDIEVTRRTTVAEDNAPTNPTDSKRRNSVSNFERKEGSSKKKGRRNEGKQRRK